MQHPFEILAPEYQHDLSIMQIRSECAAEVEHVVARLLTFQTAGRYAEGCAATGVPELFAAPSFEREAGSNFALSPAQGDPWDRVSVHVPAGIGPFPSFAAAQEAAYRIDGLDKIGIANWTWARLAFEAELFNGFGYRDRHNMRSPYLWGGTNLQQPGKYVRDRVFETQNPDGSPLMDAQIGVMAMAVRMAQLRPALALADALPASIEAPSIISAPQPAPLGVGGGDHGALWIQQRLNALGADPQLLEDGSYGRMTKAAVRAFEIKNGLTVDAGIAGPQVIAALEAAAAG